MGDHAGHDQESIHDEQLILEKMQNLIGERQLMEDELKLELQRVTLVRTAAENLNQLAKSQGEALDVQCRILSLYKELSGNKLDQRGASVFKDHLLYISSAGLVRNIEEALVVPDFPEKQTQDEKFEKKPGDVLDRDQAPTQSESLPANIEKAFGVSPAAFQVSEYNQEIAIEFSNESGIAMDCSSCTRQLWAMTPIGAGWTESMQLGAQFQERATEEYCMELQAKNIELGSQLSLCMLQLRMTQEAGCRLMDAKKAVDSDLTEAKEEVIALSRKLKELEDQELLSKEIWGPITRPRPDASWDLPPVLLSGEECEFPITVGGVAVDLGHKCTHKELHRLGSLVCQAFVDTHGRKPELKIFYGKDGSPERVSCYTDKDRALISRVILQHFGPSE